MLKQSDSSNNPEVTSRALGLSASDLSTLLALFGKPYRFLANQWSGSRHLDCGTGICLSAN